MKKLYVAPRAVWKSFVDDSKFHPVTGSHAIDLDNDMLLIAVDFSCEAHEEMWLDHPDVALLPDPMFEGNVKIADVILDSPNGKALGKDHPHKGKKFQQKHSDVLKSHATLGFDESDTVLSLSKKSKSIAPAVCVKSLR